ncbi:MAG TPA: PAS domain-containing sensor histidine kinase [Candidatus Limnocylindrales bacterium]
MPSEPESVTADGAERVKLQPPGEELFRLLVEAVQDYAIFLLSPDGHVLTWNPGAQRAKGYAARDIIGRHFSVFYTPEERDAGRPQRLLRSATDHGRVEDEGWRVRMDGTRFWADVVVTALRDATGELVAFAKITRDLTERRQAEEQRRVLLAEQRARGAAEEALKARDRFLSVASHELKTPVATLQLSAESMLRARELGRLDDARLDKGLRRILTSTRRLGDLVDELLDVSLLSAGTQPRVREPTDLAALLAEVVARFEDVTETGRILFDASATPVILAADASRLDQVFMNLLDNALKYSPDESQVEVRLIEEPNAVAVSVRDRGIGLDETTEARLFEAFSRGANAEHIQGLGLGLFISHQIVEQHGGTIRVVREAGDIGVEFRVWLPKDAA